MTSGGVGEGNQGHAHPSVAHGAATASDAGPAARGAGGGALASDPTQTRSRGQDAVREHGRALPVPLRQGSPSGAKGMHGGMLGMGCGGLGMLGSGGSVSSMAQHKAGKEPAGAPSSSVPNGLPRPIPGGGAGKGAGTGDAPQMAAVVQVGGHTLPARAANVVAGSAPRRRLLDNYDFYRTADNQKVRLGGGNYATVWKGFSRSTAEEVALKIIVKNDVTAAEANPMHAEILKMVDHKNIIQLKDYFDEEKALCLVLELAAGGDIVERVHSAGVFTEAAAVRYSRQILTALAHCHKRGLVHCDIKCENILFASRALDSELKIADFGLAQLLQRGDKLVAGRGTPEYVAPEVIESTGYDTSADMWSVGVLIYTWMSGIFPFSVADKDVQSKTGAGAGTAHHRDLLYSKISEGKYSEAHLDKVSVAAKDFIRRLLVRSPKERMTAEQALQHPWISCASPASDPLNHNFQSLRRVREQEGVSHAFYSVLFNSSSGSGEHAPLLVAATSSPLWEELEIMGRGVAPLVTMAFSMKPHDQEQAAELISNYLLKRGFRERLVEGGVFRALCHLAESQNIKVLNFVGLAIYRIAGGKEQRAQIAKNIPLLQKMLLLGQHRSNTVARQAGRALCEMLKEETIRETLLDKGVLIITCRLLKSDMIAHQAEALASWGYLAEHAHMQKYLLEPHLETIRHIHDLISRENTSHTTLGVFFQASFILQTLTKDHLLQVGPQIVAHALPTLQTLVTHAMELIKSPALRTMRRLMVVYKEAMATRATQKLRALMADIEQTQSFGEEITTVQHEYSARGWSEHNATAAVEAVEAQGRAIFERARQVSGERTGSPLIGAPAGDAHAIWTSTVSEGGMGGSNGVGDSNSQAASSITAALLLPVQPTLLSKLGASGSFAGAGTGAGSSGWAEGGQKRAVGGEQEDADGPSGSNGQKKMRV